MHLKVGRWILNILPYYLLSYMLGSFYQGIPQKKPMANILFGLNVGNTGTFCHITEPSPKI